MRVVQPQGTRGSLKWIQIAVNQKTPGELDQYILGRLANASTINWLSPLSTDDFSEYRDNAFLEKIGVPRLADALAKFWPRRGPQWDALGISNSSDILLVEAKAHIGELCSPPSQASQESLKTINNSLEETASSLGAKARVPWGTVFYQLTNRLAHLYFLRKNGVKAWLVLVNFVGDDDMKGPATAAEWDAAYEVVWHVLGLPKRHGLAEFIIEVCPEIRTLVQH